MKMKQIKIFNQDVFPYEEDFVNAVNVFCDCNNVVDINIVMKIKNGDYFASIMIVYIK
jgi:hypothetical protein